MAAPPKQRHRNRILAALPDSDLEQLIPHLEPVSLKLGQILQMPDTRIERVYFPTSGIVSLLATLEGGETVETGVVGREGMVGIAVVFGVERSTIESLVQGTGEAMTMKSETLRTIIKNGGTLHDLLLRYVHSLFSQISQTAACNRVHTLNERLARWLLLTHDRIEKDNLELTHEFLARMLGTRRAGVSVAAHSLREAGLIDYTRGDIEIQNRRGLESASCECYAIVKTEFDRLYQGQ